MTHPAGLSSLCTFFIILLTAGGAEVPQVLYPVDLIQRAHGTSAAPTTPAAGSKNPDEIVVINGALLQYRLGWHNGEVENIRHNGRQVMGVVRAHYSRQLGDGTITSASANEDIGRWQQPSLAIWQWVGGNPRLPGVEIRKTLTLRGDVLEKQVSICSTGDPALFTTSLEINPWTGPDDYAVASDPGYFPETNATIFTTTDWGPAGCHLFPAFVKPAAGITLGVHLFRVNGRLIYARENDAWERFGKNVIATNISGDFIGRNRSFTYDYHIRAVTGHAVDYFRSYQQEPEYVALFDDMKDPDWIDRVRAVTDCGPMDILGDKSEPPFPAISTDPDGVTAVLGNDPRNAYTWVLFGWDQLGVKPSQGNWMSYEPAPRKMSSAQVKHMIQWWHRGDSRRKAGLYDWNNSFDYRNPPYDQHPEWQARDFSGKNLHSDFIGISPWWPKDDARPNYRNRQYRDFYFSQIRDMVKAYNLDMLYIDATVGDRYPDWSTHTFLQPYDRYDFLKDYRHAPGRELPLIRNSPNSPYASGAYWEGRGLQGPGMEDRWRSVAGKMLVEKIWQFQHRWSALMCWGRNEEPYYTNYLLGLGYKPHGMLEEVRKLAYVQAAFEVRHLRLCNARYSPCFWRNEKTDVEAYVLTQGRAVFVSLIGHGKTAGAEITLETERLPFAKTAKLFVWQHQMRHPNDYPTELNAEYERRQKTGEKVTHDREFIKTWRQRQVVAPKFIGSCDNTNRLTLKAELQGSQLTMLVLSELPAVVVGEGGEPSALKIPGTADVALSGAFDSAGRLELQVDSTRICRIALIEPAGWHIREINLTGQKVVSEEGEVGGVPCHFVNLPAGGGRVTVEYGG